jgi:serine O-acetyltransferase
MIRADVRASLDTDDRIPGRRRILWAALKLALTTRLQAVVLLRLGQWLARTFPPFATVTKYISVVITGADIAVRAEIGPGLRLFHPVGVVIGPDCVLGARCTIMQGVTLGAGAGGSPHLGDDVFVGAGAKIFGALTIGDRSVIGANAVVIDSVPADSFAAGVPARVIKRVENPHQVRTADDERRGR